MSAEETHVDASAGAVAQTDSQTGEPRAGGARVEGGWGRFRDRAVSAGLAFSLLTLGFAAGPMTSEPRIPAPPNIAPAAMLQPVALRDAPVASGPGTQTVRVAASLRRLAAPEEPIGLADPIDAKQTHPTPEVEVTVDISDQRATVVVNGVQTGYYKVSTGLGRHWTPTGMFPPKWLNRHHRSSIYNNAPMPYSVFFNGNIALHGTNQVSKLGRPASKGCVRLHPSNARKIFNLIYRHGRDKVQITVQD